MENVEILNKVYIRQSSGKTYVEPEQQDFQETVIGWFTNKYNPVHGWSVHVLDINDANWLEDNRINTTNVFRILSCSLGDTTLAKFDFENGNVAFFDNQKYFETGFPSFEKFYAFKKFFFDDEEKFAMFYSDTNTF